MLLVRPLWVTTVGPAVPPSSGERAAYRGADIQLLTIAGGHHNLRRDPHARYKGQVWHNVGSEASRFFQRHLLPRDVDEPTNVR
jgi:hypothetical protein